MRKVFITMLCCLLMATLANAAPVRIPGGKADEGVAKIGNGKFIMGVGAEYDHVDTMKFKESSEVNFDSAAAVVSLAYDRKYSVYGIFGEILGPEFIDNNGGPFKATFDDTFMWGAGANGIIYEQEGLQFFADGSYSEADDMDFNKITFGSTEYTKADLLPGASIKGKFEQWQAALGVAKDFEWIKPYGGVLYVDSKSTVKVSVTGNSESASVKNKDKVGVFAGMTVTPLKWLGLNVQGRFIGETAVMGSVTLRF